MKKHLYAILFAAIGLLTFTACDKDSDEPAPANPYESQLIGHWTVQVWSGFSTEDDGSEDPFYFDNVTGMEFIFNEDHTGQRTYSNDPDITYFRYEFSVQDNDDMFVILYSENESYYCQILEINGSHLKFGEVMSSMTSIYECTRK